MLWLKDPVVFDPQHCHLLYKDRRIKPLSYIAAFQQGSRRFWYVEYANGTGAHYKGSEVELVRSCLEEPPAQDRFAYLREVAELNPPKTDDGQKLLLMQYQKIDFVSDRSAAALYLNPGKDSPRQFPVPPLIYPFGCNASQQRTIQAAFGNQISIIQGPPGTGKTQTILNIVANLVVQEKTVLVVSNNNSAIENVVEKLEKQGLGFLTALLGSRERKTAFVETQAIEKSIPAEIDSWYSAEPSLRSSFAPSSPRLNRCRRFSNDRSGWLVPGRSCRGCKPSNSISSRRQRLTPPSRFVGRCRRPGC